MKIRIRPDDPGMLKEPDWRQMNDWLAELRDDGHAEPARPGRAELHSGAYAEPPAAGRAELHSGAYAEPPAAGRAELHSGAYAEPPAAGRAELHSGAYAEPPAAGRAEPYAVRPVEQSRGSDHRPSARASGPTNTSVARAGRGTRADDNDSVEITVRAIIGDQLRVPIMWCEMGSCISWHSDPAALGEADTRARAIGAGWRVDALGRLACPGCQQTDPGFRASHPVALWNREEAVTMAGRIGAVRGDRTAGLRLSSVPPRD